MTISHQYYFCIIENVLTKPFKNCWYLSSSLKFDVEDELKNHTESAEGPAVCNKLQRRVAAFVRLPRFTGAGRLRFSAQEQERQFDRRHVRDGSCDEENESRNADRRIRTQRGYFVRLRQARPLLVV